MHFVCEYSSGKKYGPDPTFEYRATVTTGPTFVTVNYTIGGNIFASDEVVNSKPDASIELKLTKEEAMQLVAAILAQANHPNYHNLPVTWVPAIAMPKLERNLWEERLILTTSARSSVVKLQNNSAFHIGTVRLEIRSRIDVRQTHPEIKFVLIKTLDLQPNQGFSIDISRKDLPAEYQRLDQTLMIEVTGADILEVKGIEVSQA